MHNPCPPDQAPIKPRRKPHPETAADPRPVPPAAQECGRRRSASDPDRPPGSVACRTAGSLGGTPRRRSGRSWWFSHGPSPAPRPHAGRDGSERSVTPRPVRRARSGSAAGSPCSAETTAGCARTAGMPRGSCPNAAITARSAASPAASGPASNSCSGGCIRARTISASPSAVKPRNCGRNGSSARAVHKSGASAARLRADKPARSTTIPPTGSAA